MKEYRISKEKRHDINAVDVEIIDAYCIEVKVKKLFCKPKWIKFHADNYGTISLVEFRTLGRAENYIRELNKVEKGYVAEYFYVKKEEEEK